MSVTIFSEQSNAYRATGSRAQSSISKTCEKFLIWLDPPIADRVAFIQSSWILATMGEDESAVLALYISGRGSGWGSVGKLPPHSQELSHVYVQAKPGIDARSVPITS